MDGLRQRINPYRSSEYLSWAKTQYGKCCICNYNPGSQLHHLEPGLGKKGSDLLVARVCPQCHQWAEGKRRMALDRLGKSDVWIDMLTDALELITGYTIKLELAKKNK